MYKALKRMTLNVQVRFAYRSKLRKLKARMRKIKLKEAELNALILKWQDKANTATILADRANQETQHVWTKLQNIVHDITMIGSAPRQAEDTRVAIRKHVEITRKELVN